MIKPALASFAFAVAATLAGIAPAMAANEFHATVVPTICTCDDGSASAQWVNHPNQFHLALDLQATGCGVQTQVVTPETAVPPTGSSFAGGLITRSTLHPIEKLSFDVKINNCGSTGEFYLIAQGSNDSFYTISCEDAVFGNAVQGFDHISFNRASFNPPAGVNIVRVWIGLDSTSSELTVTGTVKNLLVNGEVPIEVTKPAIQYCPTLTD